MLWVSCLSRFLLSSCTQDKFVLVLAPGHPPSLRYVGQSQPSLRLRQAKRPSQGYWRLKDGKKCAKPSFSGRKEPSAKTSGLVVRPELRRVMPTKLYRRAVSLSNNLPVLLEIECQTFTEFFNLLITKTKVFSAPLKTIQFEYFSPLKMVIRQTPVRANYCRDCLN